MSYNNQPDWETYKPTIKESAPKKKKIKIVIKKKPKVVIKKKPSILIQEEQLLNQLVIPKKYAMSLFGPDEDEELGIFNVNDLMGKLTKRFVETINSVNMSKDEKELLHYFSGKKNAKRR